MLDRLSKNNIVNIPNIDSKIWNIENKILEMSSILYKNRSLTITLDNEGPSCQSLGLYDILDKLTDIFKVEKKLITIITRNLLEQHEHYTIVIDDDMPRPLFLDVNAFDQNIVSKDVDNILLFGCLIGRPNWPRLYIASQLYKTQKENIFLTYHYDPTNDYNRDSQGIEDLIKNISDHHLIHDAFDFIKQCPIVVKQDQEQIKYPILASSGEAYKCNTYYKNFLIDVVCETYYSKNTFFPTEKTFRPILNKTPFIIFGAPGYLKQLKKIGFKTFDRWWPELYNEDAFLPTDMEAQWSIFEILKIIDTISKKSKNEIKSMYVDMLPTLEYNFNHLKELYEKKHKKRN